MSCSRNNLSRWQKNEHAWHCLFGNAENLWTKDIVSKWISKGGSPAFHYVRDLEFRSWLLTYPNVIFYLLCWSTGYLIRKRAPFISGPALVVPFLLAEFIFWCKSRPLQYQCRLQLTMAPQEKLAALNLLAVKTSNGSDRASSDRSSQGSKRSSGTTKKKSFGSLFRGRGKKGNADDVSVTSSMSFADMDTSETLSVPPPPPTSPRNSPRTPVSRFAVLDCLIKDESWRCSEFLPSCCSLCLSM